jgi:Fe-S cluster biogenesis protein NfuA
MVEKIQKAIDSKIRPLLAEHNGDIELIKVKDGIVEVKLLGACSGCPSARFTMEELVESVILKIPEVKQVKMVDPISSEMLDLARQLLKK